MCIFNFHRLNHEDSAQDAGLSDQSPKHSDMTQWSMTALPGATQTTALHLE